MLVNATTIEKGCGRVEETSVQTALQYLELLKRLFQDPVPDNLLLLPVVYSLKSLPFSKLAPYASLTSMRRCILHFPSDEYAPLTRSRSSRLY